jgi:hypothetical protein
LTRLRLARPLALVAIAASVAPAVALAAGARFKGHVGADRSQSLKFSVSGGKVRNFEAVIYATCYSGGMLTTVTIPPTRVHTGRFSTIYQPVKSSQTFVYVRGTVSGSKASGTISETGSCTFQKQRWSAKGR